MNRRDFLTMVTKISLAGLLNIALPAVLRANTSHAPRSQVEATAFGATFLGTKNGQILESKDKEEDWQVAADLGEDCPILELFYYQDKLFAKVGFHEHEFFLKSPDGQVWYSIDAKV